MRRDGARSMCWRARREFRWRRFSARSMESPGRWIRPQWATQRCCHWSAGVQRLRRHRCGRRPSLDVLKGLDAVVFDIQDAGARFYTYETTLGYFLEAAAKAGIEIIVLDRPNPITGSFVQGPVADPGQERFTNYFSIPVRHGMTIGELAQMFNAERKIGAKLKVVAMEGWLRGDWFDSTGLDWINPSPNLRSLKEAELYPGVALIEGTNVSVGRGTDTPFEWIGAPWIKARELAGYLNARALAGVRFVPVSFTPASSTHAGSVSGREHRRAGSKYAGRTGVGNGTGLGVAQALSERFQGRANERVAGQPVGLRRAGGWAGSARESPKDGGMHWRSSATCARSICSTNRALQTWRPTFSRPHRRIRIGKLLRASWSQPIRSGVPGDINFQSAGCTPPILRSGP